MWDDLQQIRVSTQFSQFHVRVLAWCVSVSVCFPGVSGGGVSVCQCVSLVCQVVVCQCVSVLAWCVRWWCVSVSVSWPGVSPAGGGASWQCRPINMWCVVYIVTLYMWQQHPHTTHCTITQSGSSVLFCQIPWSRNNLRDIVRTVKSDF